MLGCSFGCVRMQRFASELIFPLYGYGIKSKAFGCKDAKNNKGGIILSFVSCGTIKFVGYQYICVHPSIRELFVSLGEPQLRAFGKYFNFASDLHPRCNLTHPQLVEPLADAASCGSRCASEYSSRCILVQHYCS